MISKATPDPVDVLELLATLADDLFDVARHLHVVGREVDARHVVHVGIEIAVRERYLAQTGKVGSLYFSAQCLDKLRARQDISKAAFQRLKGVWEAEGQQPKTSALFEVASALRSSPSADVNAQPPPRPRDQAKQAYRGVTFPPSKMASALRQTSRKPMWVEL